ncbi:G2/M phase-specific E3 ubiquitin-protein ligase [Dissostichus eleginoides]|uniref:G2/M phase-specific E3 ubiquitin-protein ligase n=1 Tax=Dissostichus eleginoides TaxID=100907 RepID=A0AAD9CKC7_DISEL|nr:G2/M phase-specific E3 ubiquitin-protein ligase [Dissostichus eleginoides]
MTEQHSNAEILRSVRHLMFSLSPSERGGGAASGSVPGPSQEIREQRQGGQNERPGGQNERQGGQNERPGGQNERQGGQNERPGGQNERPGAQNERPGHQPPRPSLQMEITRSFPGMFTKGRGKRRFPAATLVPAKRPKPLEVAFHLLPKTYEKTPIGPEQLVHLQAGLGRRTANIDESTTHNELLTEHIKSCNIIDIDSDENLAVVEDSCEQEWVTVQDLTRAISQFRDDVLSIHESKNPLLLSMDIRSSPAEQDAVLICFYKKPNIEWGRPLKGRFEGDAAIGEGVSHLFFSTCMDKLNSGFCINFANTDVTRLFDGEPGHLVPSASHFLVESDMFIMAGRMVGHSFVHGGPCLSGLSPAVVHVLLGGSPETATVTLEDCPDLDIRATIRLLEGESELSDEGKRSMLIHAVIGRVIRQIKQLRRGLKETPMWAMLSQRPDTVALLFPQEGAVDYSPAVILQRITWPRDDEDDDCSVDTKCRVSGYLRRFIENASPDVRTNLVKFWTGWEILPRNNLSIEVVNGRFPTASTCYETLRIPGHYKDYASFENDMLACIGTCQTGFGLV